VGQLFDFFHCAVERIASVSGKRKEKVNVWSELLRLCQTGLIIIEFEKCTLYKYNTFIKCNH